MRKFVLPCLAAGSALTGSGAFAATATSTFQVSATIQAQCVIASASALNFGTQGVLANNIDQTSTIDVQCTNTTPYTIGFDVGTGAGATVANRLMSSGGATINYTLYCDSSHTTLWGYTIGANTVASTGAGSTQSFTVYARIPAQSTPAPGTYTDTISVTVTY